MNNKINIARNLLIFTLIIYSTIFSQTTEELKRFMDTYDKIKVDQQANNIVKEGLEAENDIKKQPIKLLITPKDISKYYDEKINSLYDDLYKLNNLLDKSDSVKQISDFGYNYFSLRDSIPIIDNVRIDNNYVLGFGDEIIISVWGEVQQFEKKIIQRDGTVFIDNVGLLYLGGKDFLTAKKYIFDRFSKIYSTLNSKPQLSYLEVSLGSLKNINVKISGHINYPGNYTVNPSINLLNLLIMSGGVKKTGSLRKIFHIRNNAIIDSVDLYPMLSGLRPNNPIKLLDSDMIMVPSKGNVVAITGQVRNPAYYEIVNDKINNIVSYAGGLSKNAKSDIFLYSTDNSNSFISLNEENNFFLSNGDSIVVPYKNVQPKYITVSVDGRNKTTIPWIYDLKYEDIFSALDIDISNVKKVELTRKTKNEKYELFLLKNYEDGQFLFLPYDFVSIQLVRFPYKINTITLKGHVKSPGTYALAGIGENLNSLIERSGGILPDVNISDVIIKRDSLFLGSKTGDLILSPNDTVFVKSFNGIIKVEGEVHNPGGIEWNKYRKTKDYLSLAGGITAYADKKHIIYVTPYGEAMKIKLNSGYEPLPGSKIIVVRKPDIQNDRIGFQQISSIITSLVSLALLANSISSN